MTNKAEAKFVRSNKRTFKAEIYKTSVQIYYEKKKEWNLFGTYSRVDRTIQIIPILIPELYPYELMELAEFVNELNERL